LELPGLSEEDAMKGVFSEIPARKGCAKAGGLTSLSDGSAKHRRNVSNKNLRTVVFMECSLADYKKKFQKERTFLLFEEI